MNRSDPPRCASASLEQVDSQAVLHPITSLHEQSHGKPMIITGADGIRVHASDGTEYIDAASGLWCVNVGYGRQRVAEAAYHEMCRLSFYHTFGNTSNAPSIKLAEKILTILRSESNQPQMTRLYYGNGGSDANDTAAKMVRYYAHCTGNAKKTKIISRIGGYHGSTIAAASLTGIPFYHRQFGLPMEGITHVSCPHYYTQGRRGESERDFARRLADELESKIQELSPETVGGFIAEPIMGTGGVILPPEGYFDLIVPILQKYDILLIADEVITGFGRLGSWFGSAHYNFRPDFITMAKGLTSGYFPMSAVAISQRVMDAFGKASRGDGPIAHGFTYSGHPVGAAVGLECLAIVEEENLVENARVVGSYFRKTLGERIGGHPAVGSIRGDGLMLGIEFVKDRETRTMYPAEMAVHKQVQKAGFRHGVMLRALPQGAVIAMSPPLNMTRRDADEIVDRVGRAVDDAFLAISSGGRV